MIDTIRKTFSEFDIPIDDKSAEKLLIFYNELVIANESVNLTAITDFKEVVIKHFLDSASFVRSKEDLSDKSIIDVGTGAGFPGLVLAILCPGLKVTLLETLNKRCRFLEDISLKLDLDNVKIINGRAEDFGKNTGFREKFDYSTSRAVASLDILSEYLLPFVKVGGFMVAYKGKNSSEEVEVAENAVLSLGGKFKGTFDYSLPEDSGERALLLFEKISNTPEKFPRKAGIPSKRPL